MKPRYERISKDVIKMLDKAEKLVERADAIEKAKMCPCGSGKPMASCCPDMKKYGSSNMKKATHHNSTIESTESGGAEFHIVQGESSRNMFYYTNNSLLESTDVANKGASSSSMDLDGLHKKLNPHDVNIKIDTAGGRDSSGQSRE